MGMGDSNFWYDVAVDYSDEDNLDPIEVWGDNVTHVNISDKKPIEIFDNQTHFAIWARKQLQQQTPYVDPETYKVWLSKPKSIISYDVILPEDGLNMLLHDREVIFF